MKETCSVSVIEALPQQQPPANFVKSLAVWGLRCKTELLSGTAPSFKTPKPFGQEVGIGTSRKSREARLCLSIMPMLALGPEVARNSSPSRKLPYQQQRRKNRDASHWSSFSCTLDSS